MKNELLKKLQDVADGKLSLSEVTGMSFEQAKAIAKLGCDLAAAERLEEAKVLFEGLVVCNAKDAAAHAALGTVYQKLNQPDDARKAYDRALALDPKQVVALGNRGELRIRRGDAEGWKDLKAAVAVDAGQTSLAGQRAKALLAAAASKPAQA